MSEQDKHILLMTRPLAASERFVAGLSQNALRQARVIYAPLIEITATDASTQLEPSDSAIFTSANGVNFAPDGAGRVAFCVGERTAAHAKAKGWQVKTCAQNAEELVESLVREVPKGRLIHLAGAYRRGDIAQHLSKAGHQVSVQELYTQMLLPLSSDAVSGLSGEAPVIVPLFSPRTAAQFGVQAGAAPNAHIVAMSAAVADALAGTPVRSVHILPEPTGYEMRQSVEKLLCSDRLP